MVIVLSVVPNWCLLFSVCCAYADCCKVIVSENEGSLHMVRHPCCVFIKYNWINQLPNTTIWWLDICCLLHRYQLHVSALMAIFRLID